MSKRKTVIIGGVAGGASCAARLRRLDEHREIIILERGEYISFANCGLPYHVGYTISNRNALLLMTPELMHERFNIDVRTSHEAISIDRKKQEITVRNLRTGTDYIEKYDDLVIATGSKPLRPDIPGIDSEKIRVIWSVPDADAIRKIICSQHVKNAAVIGGGFIGLEMADNLWNAGIKTTIIEAADQVMPPLDQEMARLVHENLRKNGVNLYLSDGVKAFKENGDHIIVLLNSGKEIQTDLVILAIGVRPNGNLAKEAGLLVNDRGGIIVNEHMRTVDQSIYAVGDAVEVRNFVSGERTMIPLAGPANKQGRAAADNLMGIKTEYIGTQGSSIVKVFDLTVGTTGINEKDLIRRGLKKGEDYQCAIVTQNSHAGYYPGASPMTIKLLFEIESGKIYGAQIVGRDGVDKRIDTLGVAIRLGADIKALKELELAYAPPYSSAKDPVNMVGFMAENITYGLVFFADWNELENNNAAVILDVREDAESTARPISGSVHIPLGKLREQLSSLSKEKEYIVFCAVGVRAYYASRILLQHGFKNVKVYPGGIRFYDSTHSDCCGTDKNISSVSAERMNSNHRIIDEKKNIIHIDCCGMQCPGPITEVFRAMEKMQPSEMLEIVASDPGFSKDIVSWCERTGNTLVSSKEEHGKYVAVIRKNNIQEQPVNTFRMTKGKTIVVFDGDMDKALASFVIANGALAMGRPVTMFFTFWGLSILRKPERVSVNKSFIERMFDKMLPRGAAATKLSRMNFGGIGTALMKKTMKRKNVESLQDMIQSALQSGVKLVACSMSMDVMGISVDELIDGVVVGGVGAYLGDAEEADVNLFI